MMPSDMTTINNMIDKFCQLLNLPMPHEVARLNLCRKMAHLSAEASRKSFRSMADFWKYNNFPPPAEWSVVIEQSSFIDESASRAEAFICKDEEKPSLEDWDNFNKTIALFCNDKSIPDEEKPYLTPEVAMIGWQKRHDELHSAIKHLNAVRRMK
jgi:hypothetical protein